MRDGCKVEPGQYRETNEVLTRISLQICPLFDSLNLDRSLMHKILELRPEIVVTESDGSVGPSYCTASIDPLIFPDLPIDYPRHKVLYLMRGNQRSMDQREKNREALALGVAEGFGTIYTQTHAVVRFTETTEKLEEGAALPRLQINPDALSIAFSLHAHMIIFSLSRGVLQRSLWSEAVRILPSEHRT